MAGIREVRCVGPSAQLADRKASAQRTINWYLSATESPGEDKQFILRACPGFSDDDDTVMSGALRAMCGVPGTTVARIFFIDGSAVKELSTSDGVVTTLTGSLSSSTGRCRMVAGSNDKIVIVDGNDGYVVDTSADTVTAIADADFPTLPTQIEYLDGYYIVNGGGEQFAISAQDDPTSWDALDFSSADRLPDNIIAIRTSRQELYLFGETSTEIWVNTGAADFPFERYTQAPIDIGIAGPEAAVNTSAGLVFAGRQGRNGPIMIFMMEGHVPRRISTRAVEEALAVYDASFNGLSLWTYSALGAEFVGIDEHPGINALSSTWVYDLATKEWHERTFTRGSGSLAAVGVEMSRGDPYIGLLASDGTTYKIYPWLESVYVQGNTSISRSRTWPHLIHPSAEPVKYSSLELFCTTGSGASAAVSLEISNDGGETFGTARSITISASDKAQRVRWLFLGSASDRVFRISSSSNAALNIHGAQVEVIR